MTSRLVESQLVPPVSARDHIMGLESAAVTLLEYGDYESPHCHDAYLVVKDMQKWFGNHLRFVFRHFPLTERHPHAQRAAEAAEAASVQGRFWEMHDYLFEHQQLLCDRHLLRYASKLGLDTDRFWCELAACFHVGRVQEERAFGISSGVVEAPTFFINGTRYTGIWELDDLLLAIDEAAIHYTRSRAVREKR